MIGEYEIPVANSGPRAIAAFPDGRLFFSAHDIGAIGERLRMSTNSKLVPLDTEPEQTNQMLLEVANNMPQSQSDATAGSRTAHPAAKSAISTTRRNGLSPAASPAARGDKLDIVEQMSAGNVARAEAMTREILREAGGSVEPAAFPTYLALDAYATRRAA